MKKQVLLPKKDNEALCAYLDGALTGEERHKFELRLAKSPRLQQSLREYTQLRSAVRSLPCHSAPRNFSLTREEARALKRQPLLYPAFGFASLAAVLVLALGFTSEFIFKAYSAPMAREISSEPSLAAVPAAENAPQPQEAPLIFSWGGAYGMGGGGGAGGKGDGIGGASYGAGGGFIIAGNSAANAEGDQSNLPAEASETLPSEPAGAGVPETSPTEAPQAETFSALVGSEPVEPLILGIREAEAGQIVASYPPAQAKAAPETAADSQPDAQEPLISEYLKLGLLAAALLFAVLAVVLYLKR